MYVAEKRQTLEKVVVKKDEGEMSRKSTRYILIWTSNSILKEDAIQSNINVRVYSFSITARNRLLLLLCQSLLAVLSLQAGP